MSTRVLPLRWLRLPLLIATLGLSCVCIAVGAQALDKGSKLEKRINLQTNGSVSFDINNIRATSIVLTMVASLIAIVSLVFALALASDWTESLFRPVNNSKLPRQIPFSTRTLKWQTILLLFLSVWLLGVLIPSTVLSRTGSGHLHGQGVNFVQTFGTRYWDYGFFRCLAAAPWFTLVFSLPASVVSGFAWRYGHESGTSGKF